MKPTISIMRKKQQPGRRRPEGSVNHQEITEAGLEQSDSFRWRVSRERSEKEGGFGRIWEPGPRGFWDLFRIVSDFVWFLDG